MVLQYLGRGIHHAQRDMPCQDFVLARRLRRSGLLVLALSDGAGNAQYAQLAARINCGAVVSFFGKLKTEAEFGDFLALPEAERAQQLLTHCRQAIEEHMKRQRCEKVSAFSATLLFAVIGHERVLIGHLGDGGIYCWEGDTLRYSPGENIDGLKNATYFTVSRSAAEHLRLTVLPRGNLRGLLLTSDGTSGLFQGGRVPLKLLQYTVDGKLRTNRGLREALRQLVQVPMLRMDDWSVLLWTENPPDAEGEAVTEPVDMLAEEQEKLLEETTEQENLEKESAEPESAEPENLEQESTDTNNTEQEDAHGTD